MHLNSSSLIPIEIEWDVVGNSLTWPDSGVAATPDPRDGRLASISFEAYPLLKLYHSITTSHDVRPYRFVGAATD
jgi:hypothetical protein